MNKNASTEENTKYHDDCGTVIKGKY